MDRRAVCTADRAIGQKHPAHRQIENGPNSCGERVPQGHVEARRAATEYRADDLKSHGRDDDESHEVQGPFVLGIFHSDHVPHAQRQRAEHQEGVPDPEQPPSPLHFVQRRAAQARDEIIEERDERRCERPEQHAA